MDPVKNTYFGLGGTALEHISKVIIRLEKTASPGFRRARLVKHRSHLKGRTSILKSPEMGSAPGINYGPPFFTRFSWITIFYP